MILGNSESLVCRVLAGHGIVHFQRVPGCFGLSQSIHVSRCEGFVTYRKLLVFCCSLIFIPVADERGQLRKCILGDLGLLNRLIGNLNSLVQIGRKGAYSSTLRVGVQRCGFFRAANLH